MWFCIPAGRQFGETLSPPYSIFHIPDIVLCYASPRPPTPPPRVEICLNLVAWVFCDRNETFQGHQTKLPGEWIPWVVACSSSNINTVFKWLVLQIYQIKAGFTHPMCYPEPPQVAVLLPLKMLCPIINMLARIHKYMCDKYWRPTCSHVRSQSHHLGFNWSYES